MTKKELLDVIVEANARVTYQTKGTYEQWLGSVKGVRMLWQRILAALPTEFCTQCDGTGRVAPGVHLHTGQQIEAGCSTCHGSGWRLMQRDVSYGVLSSTALSALNTRREQAKKNGQVNNMRLPAGSSMYYYCKLCGLLAATLPEDHVNAPPKHCTECKIMMTDARITADDVKHQAGAFKVMG